MLVNILFRAAVVSAHPAILQNTQVAVVNLGSSTGSPKHLASGLLYGVPVQQDQIPDHFYEDMGFNYLRAGGTHLPDGNGGRGWITGLEDYQIRMDSAISNLKTCQKYGANFNLLIADIWGDDAGQAADSKYPGDDGDWSDYDAFLTKVISDIKSNGPTTGLTIDIWNEPDYGTVFWNRTQEQFLDMWGWGYARLRKELPEVPLLGPSTAYYPGLDNTWWTKFAAYVKSNNSIPDEWVWHMELGYGDMETTTEDLYAVLDTYDLPRRPVNINEYATAPEQTPVFTAWWIAQLERVNARGLRGVWVSAAQVFDLFGGLISKPNADNDNYDPEAGGYYPTGEYQVYKYYNRNMTGNRVATTASSDRTVDAYATVNNGHAKILFGSRSVSDTAFIKVNDISCLGLPESGTLDIKIWAFPFPNGRFGEVNAPVDHGWGQQNYTGNSATFPVYPQDDVTAYAFEIGAK
ncbi:unnamed protein product [Clonostachys byssicola]|uniref:Glycoside hydrolase family 39 protein n=1 Tax=Clonostachys byssicola TaxID=160290 RepID=A0A9N9UV22_9HYPO|nr:unnamed protein product [Clonostachys byssicola]